VRPGEQELLDLVGVREGAARPERAAVQRRGRVRVRQDIL